MNQEQELWTFAAALLRRYGDRTPIVIAERIGLAATQEADDQIDFWRTIAARIQALMDAQQPVH